VTGLLSVIAGCVVGPGVIHEPHCRFGAAFCVVERVEFVLVNLIPADGDRQVHGLSKVDLINECPHDPQRTGQEPCIKVGDQTLLGDDVYIAKVLGKSYEFVEDPLEEDVQMPVEVWHVPTILSKPIHSIVVVEGHDEHHQELAVKWLRALERKHGHANGVRIDTEAGEICHVFNVPMLAMDVDVFVLWLSRTSKAFLERACKSLFASLFTKAGFL
jgi:hypothetical protein